MGVLRSSCGPGAGPRLFADSSVPLTFTLT